MKNDMKNDGQDMKKDQQSSKTQQNQKEMTGKETKNTSSKNNQNEEKEINLGRTKRDHEVSSDKKSQKTTTPQAKGTTPQQPSRGSRPQAR